MKNGRNMISLCMMVKNEAALLPRALESIYRWVDEIIVVDTGSTDNTVEVAERFGARVFHHGWAGDFSKHRNQSIGYATGDWIFVLDADEEVEEGSGTILRKAANDNEADSVEVLTINYHNGKKSQAWIRQIRMFRRTDGIYYEGIVHNRLVGVCASRFYPIKIHHYGYDLRKEDLENKFHRTSVLINRQIQAEPGNYIHYMNLCVSYSMSGRHEKAIEAGLKAMKLHESVGGGKPDGLWMCYIVASSHIMLGNPGKAEMFSLRALRIDENCVDAYYILCVVYYQRREWANVEESASKYLELLEQLEISCNCGGGIVHSIGDKWRVHVMLAEARLRRDQLGEAERESEMAVKCLKGSIEGLVSVGDVWRRTGKYLVARSYYLRALEMEGRNADALFGLALINKAIGKTTRYGVLMDNIDTEGVDRPHILLEKARRWLELGRYAEAEQVLSRGIQLRQSG